MLKELIARTRSYRRFDESRSVSRDELVDLVDCARLSASGGNRQPLKFMLACEAALNAKIFPHLAWAAYLKDWPGPAVGERPTAYILILGDTRLDSAFDCDAGIAAQSMMLGATEKGLGGCIIASIKREALRAALTIPPELEIVLALALGRPSETVIIDPLPVSGDIRYWRDEDRRHHVPKRSLEDLILP